MGLHFLNAWRGSQWETQGGLCGPAGRAAKAHLEVTRALCRAISHVVNTEAVIYGEGPARPAIEQILREQAEGLPVHIEGRVDSDQIRNVCWSAMHWSYFRIMKVFPSPLWRQWPVVWCLSACVCAVVSRN